MTAAQNAPRLLRHLSVMTLLEGGSLLLLILIAMPLKYLAGLPSAVSLIGMLHGSLFLWTIIVLAASIAARQLPITQGGQIFLAALIPFGGFWSHRMIDRRIEAFRPG